MVAPASMISFRICRPSHMDLVARSHSAITSSSPGARLSRAFLICGRAARLLPEAVSLKISSQRSAEDGRHVPALVSEVPSARRLLPSLNTGVHHAATQASASAQKLVSGAYDPA